MGLLPTVATVIGAQGLPVTARRSSRKETKSAAARTEVVSSSDVKIMEISLLIVFYFIERINE